MLRLAAAILQAGLVAGVLVASHAFGLAVRLTLPLACGVGVAFAGYKKGSLSISGEQMQDMGGANYSWWTIPFVPSSDRPVLSLYGCRCPDGHTGC